MGSDGLGLLTDMLVENEQVVDPRTGLLHDGQHEAKKKLHEAKAAKKKPPKKTKKSE